MASSGWPQGRHTTRRPVRSSKRVTARRGSSQGSRSPWNRGDLLFLVIDLGELLALELRGPLGQLGVDGQARRGQLGEGELALIGVLQIERARVLGQLDGPARGASAAPAPPSSAPAGAPARASRTTARGRPRRRRGGGLGGRGAGTRARGAGRGEGPRARPGRPERPRPRSARVSRRLCMGPSGVTGEGGWGDVESQSVCSRTCSRQGTKPVVSDSNRCVSMRASRRPSM